MGLSCSPRSQAAASGAASCLIPTCAVLCLGEAVWPLAGCFHEDRLGLEPPAGSAVSSMPPSLGVGAQVAADWLGAGGRWGEEEGTGGQGGPCSHRSFWFLLVLGHWS